MMPKKKRGFFARRKRLNLLSEKERREYVTQTVLKTAARQRERIYGIRAEKKEEPETDPSDQQE